MERFTISLDESLAREFDELIAARGYGNRSEAVRDLIRGASESARVDVMVSDAEGATSGAAQTVKIAVRA